MQIAMDNTLHPTLELSKAIQHDPIFLSCNDDKPVFVIRLRQFGLFFIVYPICLFFTVYYNGLTGISFKVKFTKFRQTYSTQHKNF